MNKNKSTQAKIKVLETNDDEIPPELGLLDIDKEYNQLESERLRKKKKREEHFFNNPKYRDSPIPADLLDEHMRRTPTPTFESMKKDLDKKRKEDHWEESSGGSNNKRITFKDEPVNSLTAKLTRSSSPILQDVGYSRMEEGRSLMRPISQSNIPNPSGPIDIEMGIQKPKSILIHKPSVNKGGKTKKRKGKKKTKKRKTKKNKSKRRKTRHRR